MKNSQETAFWLNLAIEEFILNVWFFGLSKYSKDSPEETCVFVYGDFQISVAPDDVEDFRLVTICNKEVLIMIEFNVNDDSESGYDVKTKRGDEETITDMIYDVNASWSEHFFSLKK